MISEAQIEAEMAANPGMGRLQAASRLRQRDFINNDRATQAAIRERELRRLMK